MTTPTHSALREGTKLGRYEILRPLDAGGMGEVYLARHDAEAGFAKLVALKRVNDTSADAPEVQTALLEEAQLMSTLSHPNIAQAYDAGRDAQGAYLVMEYVRGRSLRILIQELSKRGRGMSLDNALWIVSNVAAALAYAHDKRLPDGASAGIVHRDIAPYNILLSYDGAVKLIDFGVAKALSRQSRTRPGTIKGNVRYMSPEQYIGGELDHRSDIFSLGIVLFELTTGTRWLRERDDTKAAQIMLNGRLPRPSERRAGYSVDLEAIVMKALERNRDHRYHSARDLQNALEEFARTHQLKLSNLELGTIMQQTFGDQAKASTQNELAPGEGLLQVHAGRTHALAETPVGELAEPSRPGNTLRLQDQAPISPPVAATAEALPQSGQTLPMTAQLTAMPDDSGPESLGARRGVSTWLLAVAVALLLGLFWWWRQSG